MVTELPSNIDRILGTLNEEQLRLLNRKVFERLRSCREGDDREQMAQFRITDRVWFDYKGRRCTGTVMKLNKRTATVYTDDGKQWNVSPHFLRRMMDVDVVDAEIVEDEEKKEDSWLRAFLQYLPLQERRKRGRR